jgi:hypothetical protein
MERHISALLREPAVVRWLAVLWIGQSDFVYLMFDRSLYLLLDCLRRNPGHEQAIRSILLQAGVKLISESIGGNLSYARLRYLLPSKVEDAAELMHEVLLRGCVVSERTDLLFRAYEDANPPTVT